METLQIGDQVIHKPEEGHALINDGQAMEVLRLEGNTVVCQTENGPQSIPASEIIKGTTVIKGYVGG
ncbi:hypothetical protein [Siphonobacter sp.]|uniref:hypothetical protein n=1 Tax=Siphonobacter sp. TaxID=1869184 RepID=UPI003B3BA96D